METTEWIALAGLGLFAGGLTTMAGLGGGLVMTLVLAAVWDPATALAVAAPALLLGNVQRVLMFRAHIERPLTRVVVLGAVPGAIVGGIVTVGLPETLLRILLLSVAILAVARELGLFRWRPDARSIAPAAFGAGFVTATTGGGGLLLGPLLLASGLKAERFVVTASLVATAIHLARIGAYGAGGLLDVNTLVFSGVLAVAIVVGNVLGRRARAWLSEKHGTFLTYSVLLGSVVVTVLGMR